MVTAGIAAGTSLGIVFAVLGAAALAASVAWKRASAAAAGVGGTGVYGSEGSYGAGPGTYANMQSAGPAAARGAAAGTAARTQRGLITAITSLESDNIPTAVPAAMHVPV